MIDHHHEEEGDLFPAVLAASSPGAEYDKVQRIVNRLTAEHREIEAIWRELEPAVHQLAKRKPATIDGVAVASLVQKYQAHAQFEEETFLPLSALILGRRDGKMASLGLALHMRHVLRAAKRGLRRS
ncbi:MAG: hemerythrin domain-containing protein [Burkholderiaceae bacterium]